MNIEYKNTIKNECIKYLVPHDKDPKKSWLQGKNLATLLSFCMDYSSRIPLARKRKVLCSDNFIVNNNYKVYENEIKGIISKIENGESIREHLSTNIQNRYSNKQKGSDKDFLLSHFNIHHLHISKENEYLLFCIFDNEKAILLDILKHPKGDNWRDKKLIQKLMDSLEITCPDIYRKYIVPFKIINDNPNTKFEDGCISFLNHHGNTLLINITNAANCNNKHLVYCDNYMKQLEELVKFLKFIEEDFYKILLENFKMQTTEISLKIDFSLEDFLTDRTNSYSFNIELEPKISKKLKLIIDDFWEFYTNYSCRIIEYT